MWIYRNKDICKKVLVGFIVPDMSVCSSLRKKQVEKWRKTVEVVY